MDLSSASSALKTLKHRTKVPSNAIETSNALFDLLSSPNFSIEQFEQGLSTLLVYGNERWEPIAVVCTVVSEFLLQLNEEFLLETIRQMIHEHLEHLEPRVRMAIAKLLGAFASWRLGWVYEEFLPQIMESIVCNLNRSPDFEEDFHEYEQMDDNVSVNGMETPPVSPSNSSVGSRTPRTPHALDDVSGWKSLETSLCALKYIIQGGGSEFLHRYLTPDVLDMMTTKSVFHINRHVRVVGLDTITILCDISKENGFLDQPEQRNLTDRLNKCIVRGMQDNWSQVRYAASLATKSFLLALNPKTTRVLYYGDLIPRILLNRYYIAERVSKHAQETWQLLMGTKGKQIVAEYAAEVVEYYIEMTNHCVREAACHCIGELVTKVDTKAIEPFLFQLTEALLNCLHDDSWLVRDAACLASANLVKSFSCDVSVNTLDTFFTLWFQHVSDEIWSVREDAAISLGKVMQAPAPVGPQAIERVMAFLDTSLMSAKSQPPMSQQEYDALEQNAKKKWKKKAFSCCSLEPKCFNSTRDGHSHETPKSEPWEITDGCIYLVRELCQVNSEKGVKYLVQLADIAILRHFPQTSTLQQTLWKQLPLICDALGKKCFKQYLEVFLDPLVFTIEGMQHARLAHFAAKDCVIQLSQKIGKRIFYGRLEQNPTWKQVLGPLVGPHDMY